MYMSWYTTQNEKIKKNIFQNIGTYSALKTEPLFIFPASKQNDKLIQFLQILEK